MTVITRSITNLTTNDINLFVPGYDGEKFPIIITASATVDLFTVLTVDQLEAVQPLLREYVAANEFSVAATVDTTTFNPVGGSGSSGSAGDIQISDGSAGFIGDPNLTWDAADAILTVGATGATGAAFLVLKSNNTAGNAAIGFEDNTTGQQAQITASYDGVSLNTFAFQTGFGPATQAQITLMTFSGATNYTTVFNADGSLSLPSLSSEPGTPIEGEIIYNSATHNLEYYNGTAWVSL